MPRMNLSILAPLAALLVASAAVAGELPARSSHAAGVTVSVTPRSLSGPVWEFEVALNTHSGDLSDDLMKTAVLVADGAPPEAPAGWQGAAPGGHHRRGVLRFKAVSPPPAAIAVRMQRPGEPAPREFRWSLR